MRPRPRETSGRWRWGGPGGCCEGASQKVGADLGPRGDQGQDLIGVVHREAGGGAVALLSDHAISTVLVLGADAAGTTMPPAAAPPCGLSSWLPRGLGAGPPWVPSAVPETWPQGSAGWTPPLHGSRRGLQANLRPGPGARPPLSSGEAPERAWAGGGEPWGETHPGPLRGGATPGTPVGPKLSWAWELPEEGTQVYLQLGPGVGETPQAVTVGLTQVVGKAQTQGGT